MSMFIHSFHLFAYENLCTSRCGMNISFKIATENEIAIDFSLKNPGDR